MKIVLTTGCFDLFHLGHVDYLRNITKAFPYFIRVVGLADDVTVRRLKGELRPVLSQAVHILGSLKIGHIARCLIRFEIEVKQRSSCMMITI